VAPVAGVSNVAGVEAAGDETRGEAQQDLSIMQCVLVITSLIPRPVQNGPGNEVIVITCMRTVSDGMVNWSRLYLCIEISS